MKLMTKSSEKIIRHTISYIFIFIMLAIILMPVIFTIAFSLQKGNTTFISEISFKDITFEHYASLLFSGETAYIRWYGNTLVVALLTIVMQVGIVILTSFAFSRFKFWGKKQTLSGLLFIQMIPNIIALPTFYILAVTLNMQNVLFLALIYTGGAIPMNTLLLKGYMDSIPKELDRCAKIDGASDWFVLRKIIVPLSKPMLVIMSLWAFMGPFTDFMTPKFIFTLVPDYTIATGLQTLIADPKGASYTMYAAGALMTAIPVVVLFYYVQKDLVSGILKGSVKG